MEKADLSEIWIYFFRMVNLFPDSKVYRVEYFAGTFLFYGNQEDYRVNGFEIGVTFRPSTALSLSISPSYEFNLNEFQYVTTLDLAAGEKYIFARIEQKTVSLTLRLNLSLTPDLSIQFYGQPFISAGKYSEFKPITDSRAKKYEGRFHLITENEIDYYPDAEEYYVDENLDGVVDYTFENPDFNFLQFRMNLVVRWEYIPSSSLYLVWSHGRTGFSSVGDFSFRERMQDLFSVHPHNVFLVKFSYCFQL